MQAQQAIKSARTYLNDDLAINWSDHILFPKLQEAHSELVLELRVNGLDILYNQSAVITVPAGTVDLTDPTVLQPTNIVEVMELLEGNVGAATSTFVPMARLTFVPLVDQTRTLNEWAWLGQKILLSGATENRDVIIRYKGSLVTPVKLTDEIGVIMGELYLGPRIASLAMSSIGQDGSAWEAKAKESLYKIVQANVTADQRPVRRKRYRGNRRNVYGVTVPLDY